MKYSNEFTMFAGLKGQDAAVLDQWLDQYQLKKELFAQDDSLEDEFEPYTEEDLKKIKDAISEFDSDLSVGQIRLWSSEMVEDKDVPPYFVILSKEKNDMWLIAPFSPLTLPAHPGEMTTGLDIPFCQTLQCWNTMLVQSCLVARSWLVDTGGIPQNLMQSAIALIRNQESGEELPSGFGFLRGGEILNPFDPRYLYLQENKYQFSPLKQKIGNLNFFRDKSRISVFHRSAESETACMSIAAADTPEEISRKFAVEEFACILSLYIEPDDDPLLTVTTENGDDFSGLDGFAIRNIDGEIIAEIDKSRAFIPADKFDGTLLITKPDGWPVTLIEN